MLTLLFQISIFDLLYDKTNHFYDIVLWDVISANFSITRSEGYIVDIEHFHTLISLIGLYL